MSSNRGIAGRRSAWMAEWFSGPVSPGCHPGLLAQPRTPHKKPPAEAGGLRVAHLPACHAIRVRTREADAASRHGRRDRFQTREMCLGSRAQPGYRKPEPTPGWRRRRESLWAQRTSGDGAWTAPHRRSPRTVAGTSQSGPVPMLEL